MPAEGTQAACYREALHECFGQELAGQMIEREEELRRRITVLERSRRLRVLLLGALVLSVLSFAALVWPSIYRYDRWDGFTVRINRVTGDTDLLRRGGWSPMR